MRKASLAALAAIASMAALGAACASAPPTAVAPAARPPAPSSPEAKAVVGPTISVPASAAAIVSLPGIWYSNKAYESYQIILLQDGKYINRGKNPQGLDIEDKGTWKVDKDLFVTSSERGEERVWRFEHAEDNKVILKAVKVKESPLGELMEWDRISSRDLVGVWLDETGNTHYRLILTADQKYILEGTPKEGPSFRDSGSWRLASMFFIAKSGTKSEERIWDLVIGLDLKSITIRNLVVKEGELGREMHLVKAD